MVLASLLKNNPPRNLVDNLKRLHYNEREIKDAVFLINLLLFKPEYIYDFKKELIKTSLTKRQVLDWAKINNLDVETIEKLVDHKFSANASEIASEEGIAGDKLRDRVRSLEADKFMRSF
jgi:hypothetical protein